MDASQATNQVPTEEDGLIFACQLDNKGAAKLIDWNAVESWPENGPPLWIHLQRNSERAQRWLRERSGISAITADALLAEETRPRVFSGNRGLVTVLRGVNLNDGSEKEDMIAVRFWSEGKRLITLRDERLQSARDVLSLLIDDGEGPKSIPELYLAFVLRVNERIAPSIVSYEAQIDNIEESISKNMNSAQTTELMELRQNTVFLRRYLAPQRLALNELVAHPPKWAHTEWSAKLREGSDSLIRMVEDLDAIRDRAIVLKDDMANQLSEKINRTLYLLAILSAIFLPLTFLTGLLGVNIGGMPGVKSDSAFWLFTAFMIAILVVEVILLRRIKWI